MSAEKRKHIITPNALTILRIILSIIIIYLLFNPSFYVRLSLAFLFTAASLSDYFDGRIARKYGLITNFGKIVDPLADKVLYLGLFISFCILCVCPLWWVILIGIREVLVTVLRFVLLKQGTVIAADKFGKIKVAFQIGTVLF